LSNFSCDSCGCCVMLYSFGQVPFLSPEPPFLLVAWSAKLVNDILRRAALGTRMSRFVQQCCARACALVRFATPNMSQHVATGGPNARNMLRPTMLRYVALKCLDLRLVFTSDGVVVGVGSRSVERYDLVKIKLTGSEAEHPFRL